MSLYSDSTLFEKFVLFTNLITFTAAFIGFMTSENIYVGILGLYAMTMFVTLFNNLQLDRIRRELNGIKKN